MLKQGDPVIIHAPAFYREHRIGVIIEMCKDHDGAYRIRVLDPDAPIKDVCVNPNNGDTIELLPQKVPV